MEGLRYELLCEVTFQASNDFPLPEENRPTRSSRQAYVRIPRLAGAVDLASHHRYPDSLSRSEQFPLEPPGDLSHIDLAPPACGTRDNVREIIPEAEGREERGRGDHLVDRIAGERDPHRIAYPPFEQHRQRDSRFGDTAERWAGLCHTDVKRIIVIIGEESVRRNSDGWIGRLEAENDPFETDPLEHLEMAPSAREERPCRIGAMESSQIPLYASRVDADPDGDAGRTGSFDHRPYLLLVAYVSRVDSQTLDAGRGRSHGKIGIEVYIGNDRNGALPAYRGQRPHILVALYCYPYDLTTGTGEGRYLGYRLLPS